MGEFEEKLNSILSSPKDMKKIMDLARSLSSSESTESADETESGAAVGALQDAADGIDPAALGMMAKVIKEYSSSVSDDKSSLLMSLKPFLKSNRHDTIDKALNILKLSKVAKIAFGEFGGDFHL